MILRFLWIISYPFACLLCPTRVIGKKYLKPIKKQAYLFSANHQSNWDSVVIKYKVNLKYKIMAKASMFSNKLVSLILKWFGAYPVNRGNSDISAVKNTLKLLKENKQILVFPEGTRHHNEDEMEIKNGIVMFALRTDCYIVPAIFRKKPKLFRPNKLLIGKPFKFSDLDEFKDKKIDKDLLNRASDYLKSKMEYLKVVNLKEFKMEIKKDLEEQKNR